MGSVNSLKLSKVQTTKGDPVLWNDCPISIVILAIAPIRASPDYCQTSADGKIQVNRTLTPAPCAALAGGVRFRTAGARAAAAGAGSRGDVGS